MHTLASLHWNAYPALLLATGLACGIAGATFVPAEGLAFWLAVGGLGGVLILVSLYREERRMVSMAPLVRTAGIALLAGGIGGAAQEEYQHLPSRHVLSVADTLRALKTEVMLAGRVQGPPERTASGLRFTLEADHLAHVGASARVDGLVRVGVWRSAYADSTAPFPAVHEGDRVRVSGTLEPAPRPRNPADFDYGAYLKRRGIHAVLNAYEAAAVTPIGEEKRWPTSAVVRARTHIRTQLAYWMPSEAPRAVLKALLLGDRSSIENATQDQFARTGLMHLLAVSGLHVLLVGMVVYRLLRPFLLRMGLRWRAVEIARAAVTMSILLLFMLITGSRPSVVRAVVMASLFIGGTVLQRSVASLNTLGVAALVLLLTRPPALFDAGFQLSFAAVGAIVVFVPRLNAAIPDRWMEIPLAKAGSDLMAATVAATIGTAPVLLHHFGGVPLAGLALNIVAIPTTFLLMAAGLALVVTGGWAATLGGAFGAAADLLAQSLLTIASVGDALLPWSYLQLPSATLWVTGTVTLGIISAAQWSRVQLRWKWVIATLSVATLGAWMALADRAVPRVDVLFFDVGHGDAALVTLPNGRHLLVDAGPWSPYRDAGKQTLLPHLRHAGITRLDAVVVTHADSDHIGGLPALLRAVSVGTVLHNGQTSDTNLFDEVVHLTDSLGIPYQSVEAGYTLELDPTVHMQVLAPVSSARTLGDNNASVVLRLVYGTTSFLLTGDIEAETESTLVEAVGRDLASDVVKIPHHGSRTSSTPSFVVHATRPDSSSRAVASVSRTGRFGLPDATVVERWEKHVREVQITGTSGAIWFQSDGKNIQMVEWQ